MPRAGIEPARESGTARQEAEPDRNHGRLEGSPPDAGQSEPAKCSGVAVEPRGVEELPAPVSRLQICGTCDGCGCLDSRHGEPWSNVLQTATPFEVQQGAVKALDCPDCNGTGGA